MKTILAIAIAFVTTITNAEQIFEAQKGMICSDDASELMKRIAGPKINEKPVWFGVEADTGNSVAVLVNTQEGTYTILFVKNNFACVVSHGTTEKKKMI